MLVLGAGGTLGIAWLRGVLAGVEEATGIDFRQTEYFVGTSAGSYVGALLAAGERPHGGEVPNVPDVAAEASENGDEPGPLARLAGGGAKLAATATAPLIPLALRATRPGGRVARAAFLRATPRPQGTPRDLRRHLDHLGAIFDGRLRVVAVDRANGRRIVFGSPGAPRAGVGEAVLASCAVPWIFAPVHIGDREYVDGGVWSLSNLDVAPAGRGAEVLAFLPAHAASGARGPTGLMRAAAHAAALAELQVLRARGASVRIVAPDAKAREAIGPHLMDGRRRRQVVAAGVAQGRRLG